MPATKWKDQPDILRDEHTESLGEFQLANARSVQVLRRYHAARRNTEWYVTVGNLFGSQTAQVSTVEKVLALIAAISAAGDEDTVNLKRLGATLVENAIEDGE